MFFKIQPLNHPTHYLYKKNLIVYPSKITESLLELSICVVVWENYDKLSNEFAIYFSLD